MKAEHQKELANFLGGLTKTDVAAPTEEQISRSEAILDLTRSPEFLKAIIDNDHSGRNLLEFRLFEGIPADKPSMKEPELIVFRVQFVRDRVNSKIVRYFGTVEGRMTVTQSFEGDDYKFKRKIIKDSSEIKDWFTALYSPDGWGVDSVQKTAHETYQAFLARSYTKPEELAKRHGSAVDQIWKNMMTIIGAKRSVKAAPEQDKQS